MNVRVGVGYDVHAVDATSEGPLVLGGVSFEDHPAVVAHSDGDVIVHAIIDAVLGAASLGDIGSHFPDSDPELAGADSLALLAQVVEAITAGGWVVSNVDCVVIADGPKIAPVRDVMIDRIGSALGAPVSVKGKRTEGVGALGRGEGIAAHAVACLVAEDR